MDRLDALRLSLEIFCWASSNWRARRIWASDGCEDVLDMDLSSLPTLSSEPLKLHLPFSIVICYRSHSAFLCTSVLSRCLGFLLHVCYTYSRLHADFPQTLAVDLLNPPAETVARTHKLKKIVPEPNSFFMDVKCPGCFQIT